jgi:hypothetical protein
MTLAFLFADNFLLDDLGLSPSTQLHSISNNQSKVSSDLSLLEDPIGTLGEWTLSFHHFSACIVAFVV